MRHIEMRRIKTSSVVAVAAITLALLLQGCAASAGDTREQRTTARCGPGKMLTCDTRSSGRISDGRYGYGRNISGRGGRDSCSCVAEQDLDVLTGVTLPSAPH